MKGFEVYIVELIDSIDICVARNIHNRTRDDIEKARNMKCTNVHVHVNVHIWLVKRLSGFYIMLSILLSVVFAQCM